MDALGLMAIFLLLLVSWQLAAGDPMVNVSQGMLRGSTENFNESIFIGVNVDIDVYLGIPYAKPPKRFRPPEEGQPWEGVWNATYARDPCAQHNLTSSEDCLHLNVYVPENAKQDAAVMVWFHGGAYQRGHSTSEIYNPIPLVGLANDMIFVSANYRLGVYGFLSTGDVASPGNYGLMDQLEVLKWVNKNIAAFGGDPSRVTIVGQSAGSASVSAHLLSPKSRGYFSQAIMQSGNLLSPWAFDSSLNSKRSLMVAKELARRVECPTESTTEMVACLRDKPERVLTYQGTEVKSDIAPNDLAFKPVIDKTFITDRPDVLLQKGALNPGAILLGSNRDEGTLSALGAYLSYINSDEAPKTPLSELRELLPLYTYNYNHPQLLSAMEQYYIDWSIADNATADHFQAFIGIMTDFVYACTTDKFARSALAADNRTVYLYHLTHVPKKSINSLGDLGPKWLGVGHGEDLQYLFMYGLNPGMSFRQSREDKEVGVQVAKYWTNFVKTGNPEDPSSPSSEPWTPFFPPASPVYKDLSPGMRNGRSLKTNQCVFWNSYLPQLAVFTANSTDLSEEWEADTARWRKQDMVEWQTAFRAFKEDMENM